MRVRNHEVPRLWSAGRSARNGNSSYRTDGHNLYSYNLMIGTTAVIDGREHKILRDYTASGKWGFQSMTTSNHVGRARQHADIVD